MVDCLHNVIIHVLLTWYQNFIFNIRVIFNITVLFLTEVGDMKIHYYTTVMKHLPFIGVSFKFIFKQFLNWSSRNVCILWYNMYCYYKCIYHGQIFYPCYWHHLIPFLLNTNNMFTDSSKTKDLWGNHDVDDVYLAISCH